MSNKKLVILNSDGSVFESISAFDPSSYVPTSYSKETFITDDSLNPISVNVSFLERLQPIDIVSPDAPAQSSAPRFRSETVQVNPLTEQVLRGSLVGEFSTAEPVFQSTITPTIINNYTVGGVEDPTFIPVIGSIGVSGEIGRHSAQFKGTFNDTAAQKSCGIRLPAFTTSASTPYFLLEGWLYLEQEPSNNYDPIIVTRSADGLNNSTNDSFRLEYDTSSEQVQFHYSDSSYASAGYRGIVNVSPAGVSLNQWNHFAIAWGTTGGSASIKTYWNGTSLYSATIPSGGYLRNSTAPLVVGSGISGDYALKGWLEDVHIRMGGVTLALADYAAFGSSAPNAWEQDYAGEYTVYLLSMNGPIGSSLFPVDNLCRVTANVTYNSGSNGVLGMGGIIREESSVLGISLFGGLCGGFTATGGSGGRLFGYRSGGCMIISSVEQLVDFDQNRLQRTSAANHTNYFLMGITIMQGVSGSSGDFPKLFSSGWAGTSYSFLPIQSNINWLRNLYDNITVAGFTGNTSIEDYYGVVRGFSSSHVQKLYEDVVAYQADGNTLKTQLVNQINAASTMQALKSVQGLSAAVVLKLAPYTDRSSALQIPPGAKITKVTSIPESKYLGIDQFIPIDDFVPFGKG